MTEKKRQLWVIKGNCLPILCAIPSEKKKLTFNFKGLKPKWVKVNSLNDNWDFLKIHKSKCILIDSLFYDL